MEFKNRLKPLFLAAVAFFGSRTALALPNEGIIPVAGTAVEAQTLSWQGVDRKVLVIRPDPAPTRAVPALVLLHYDGGTPTLMANLTRVADLVANEGLIAVVPAADRYHWSDDPANSRDQTDDVGFLSSLVDTETTKYPINPAKIAVAGYSNGGFMALRMACERPDLFSAAAAVAAEMRTSVSNVCHPERPLPVLFILGTDDKVVPYDKTYITMAGAQGSFDFWSNLHNCDSNKTTTSNLPAPNKDGTTITLQQSSGCRSGGEIDLYTVDGGGHTWPDGLFPEKSRLGTESQNLDATGAIGDFIARWTTASTQ